MSNSYHQVLRRFCDARHDDDTPRTLVRARRLVGSTRAAAERVGPEGLVLGIDIAPGLLAIARAKAAAAGIDTVRFPEQSIEAFEAPAGSFDGAYCSFAIVLLAALQPFLARLRHLLATDGFLAFTSNSKESYFHPQMLAAAAGAGIALPPIHGPLASAAAIRRQLQQAGFGSCRITSLQLGTSLSLQEAQQSWDGRLWLHPHAPLATAPAATMVAIKREFDRRLEAESRDGLQAPSWKAPPGAPPCPDLPPRRNLPGKRRPSE